ncbi:SLATT domain-containing protein [Streptomyces pathocidini]|uniref:SLATT domain-containing protein n=1 Tax=Streptomyces pathocidini TaxID=1650571 RepID=A0ABW7UWG1_9ACTN|nr:SLATT domain-containing protein [Streptomyces pathocidini]
MEGEGMQDEARRESIARELKRIEESAMCSAQAQFEQTKQWRGINLLLGLPASLLAAIAGTAALVNASGRVAAGVVALASAGFGAMLTTINASHRMNQAAAAANAYLEIQTASRQVREVDLPDLSVEEARGVLAELTARRDEQNKTAEPPNRRSYKKAQENIRSGGQSYAVDEMESEE